MLKMFSEPHTCQAVKFWSILPWPKVITQQERTLMPGVPRSFMSLERLCSTSLRAPCSAARATDRSAIVTRALLTSRTNSCEGSSAFRQCLCGLLSYDVNPTGDAVQALTCMQCLEYTVATFD